MRIRSYVDHGFPGNFPRWVFHDYFASACVCTIIVKALKQDIRVHLGDLVVEWFGNSIKPLALCARILRGLTSRHLVGRGA
jgi:hypothetical protein